MTRISRSRRLLLGLAVAVGLVPSPLAQRVTASAESVTLAEQYLLSAANQERAARGLSILHRNPQLAYAAARHAQEMAAHGTISHQFAGEPELTERGASAGVPFSEISENVGEAPSVVQIHNMWMNSEHHRTNLLDPAVDSAGISVMVRNGELYAVEDFARTVRAVSLDQQESAIASLLARQASISIGDQPEVVSAARKTCSMSTGYAGTRKPYFVMRFTSDSLNQIPEQLKSKVASGRYREAAVGACPRTERSAFTSYNFAVLLYP